MPFLDGKKTARVRANVRKTFAGRDQIVILTLRQPTGGTTTLTVRAVWRVLLDADPTYNEADVPQAKLGPPPDVVAVFNTEDLTLGQLHQTIYAELGPDAVGVQPAQRYTLASVRAAGLLPGSTRLVTRWVRQH